MVQDEVRYETKAVKAVRGLESRTTAKWAQEGWELHSETPGKLRTELVFRRPKKTLPRGILLGIGGLAAVVVVGGVAAAVLLGGGTPTETVSSPSGPSSRTEPSDAPTEPSPTPEAASETPEAVTETPEKSVAPVVEPYVYTGPDYDVVVVDQNQGPARLASYWVVTDEVALSSDAYKEQVKLLVGDIARTEGSTEVMVQVVTNKDIALAESPSTYEAFVAERGMDYAVNTIPQIEKEGWIASYTGGYDYDTGRVSDAAGAYEVIWWPYATAELETWKPDIAPR